MNVKIDSPKSEVPAVKKLSDWMIDLLYYRNLNLQEGTTVEVAFANLVEILVEKGVLVLQDVPRIVDCPDKITPFPE